MIFSLQKLWVIYNFKKQPSIHPVTKATCYDNVRVISTASTTVACPLLHRRVPLWHRNPSQVQGTNTCKFFNVVVNRCADYKPVRLCGLIGPVRAQRNIMAVIIIDFIIKTIMKMRKYMRLGDKLRTVWIKIARLLTQQCFKKIGIFIRRQTIGGLSWS